MTAATASAAGKAGLAAAPAAGAQAKFLRGDGTWQNPPNTTYSALIPYIKGKISQQQYDKLMEAVRIAVAAAEQLFTSPQSGADKKQYVQEFLAAQGYDVSDQEIDTMIEATVGKINGVEV